jgi:hypothetical protein
MLALPTMRVHEIFALASLASLLALPSPASARGATATAPVVPAAALAPAESSPDAILAAVRQATAKYLDIEKALADGFVQISGMEARHGFHFMNVNAQMLSATAGVFSSGLQLSSPPMLIYVGTKEGGWQLAAAEYALPTKPAENPFPGAQWFEHEPSCHYRDYRERPSPGAAICPKRHPETGSEFVLFHPRLWIVHVWAWYPNPLGLYAAENPWLAPYGGVVPTGHDHARGRSGTEVAYSEFNHRSSGIFLLVIAALVFWQTLRRPRGIWPGVIAVLWIAFGIYLFVRSDPEAWPWGPLGLLESLRDTEVLQHKVLTLIPIVIGIAEALYGYGLVRVRPGLGFLSLLALGGGIGLFLHFHGGRFHLDWIYAQHAAMGLTGLAAGVGLLFSRRAEPGSKLHLLWPMFLLAMSAVLIFYSEQ